LSVRSHVRIANSASLLDFSCLGSALSVRHFTRLGSTLSVNKGALRIGQKVSCFDFIHLASTFSVRHFANVGGDTSAQSNRHGLSVYGVAFMSSSLSLRAFLRAGSALSVQGPSSNAKRGAALIAGAGAGVDQQFSVLPYATLGSSLSIRCQANFGWANYGKNNFGFSSTHYGLLGS